MKGVPSSGPAADQLHSKLDGDPAAASSPLDSFVVYPRWDSPEGGSDGQLQPSSGAGKGDTAALDSDHLLSGPVPVLPVTMLASQPGTAVNRGLLPTLDTFVPRDALGTTLSRWAGLCSR